MIPELNVADLMLRKDVVKAVAEGKFHIYPVSTIDQGVSILTGVEAGAKTADGSYPKGSVNDLVNEKLRAIALNLKKFGEEDKSEGTKPEED